MRFSPHMCFDGQCEAAFRLYENLFGGRITTLLSYGESPMAGQVEAADRKRIVHASLEVGEQILLGADLLPGGYARPQGFFVTLNIDELARAQHLFEALADGGEVRLPFRPTFWSAGFGIVVDRFGTPWEINCEQLPAA